MRSNLAKLGVPLVVALLTMAPSAGWALPCNTAGPVLARPFDDGGVSQFTFQIPYPPPSVVSGYHWMLVDDFPEQGYAVIRSGYINLNPSTTQTELYRVVNPAQTNAGVQFRACTIRAQLLVNGTGPTTIHFVVKGTTQFETPPIMLTANYLREYQSTPMLVNPVTMQAWTSNDLSGTGTIIGVKNDPSLWGVGIASIVLECE